VGSSVAQCIVVVLEPLLGRFTSEQALGLACKQVGCDPGRLTALDVDDVSKGLRPMLRTLLGVHGADSVLERIRDRLKP